MSKGSALATRTIFLPNSLVFVKKRICSLLLSSVSNSGNWLPPPGPAIWANICLKGAIFAWSSFGLAPTRTFASGATKASISLLFLDSRKPGQTNAPAPHRTQLSRAPPPRTTPPTIISNMLLDFFFAFFIFFLSGRSSSSSSSSS